MRQLTPTLVAWAATLVVATVAPTDSLRALVLFVGFALGTTSWLFGRYMSRERALRQAEARELERVVCMIRTEQRLVGELERDVAMFLRRDQEGAND